MGGKVLSGKTLIAYGLRWSGSMYRTFSESSMCGVFKASWESNSTAEYPVMMHICLFVQYTKPCRQK